MAQAEQGPRIYMVLEDANWELVLSKLVRPLLGDYATRPQVLTLVSKQTKTKY